MVTSSPVAPWCLTLPEGLMDKQPEISIEEACRSLDHTLKSLTSKQEKYHYIFQLGKDFPGLGQEARDNRFLVKGCISQAWLIPHHAEGRLFFDMDSEALIVKGIMALIHGVYQHRTPDEILSVDLSYWLHLDLTSLLSMNRRNGALGIIKQILLYAATYKALWT